MSYFIYFIYWLSPLLQEVFLRLLRFSPLLKNQHFLIPIRPGIRQTKNHFVDALPLNHYLSIYLFFLLIIIYSFYLGKHHRDNL